MSKLKNFVEENSMKFLFLIPLKVIIANDFQNTIFCYKIL